MTLHPLRKGHHCPLCNTYHGWPGYVYAHYDIALDHTCSECGTVVTIQSGRVQVKKLALKPKESKT